MFNQEHLRPRTMPPSRYPQGFPLALMTCMMLLVKGEISHHHPLNIRQSRSYPNHKGAVDASKGYPNPKPREASINTSPPMVEWYKY